MSTFFTQITKLVQYLYKSLTIKCFHMATVSVIFTKITEISLFLILNTL